MAVGTEDARSHPALEKPGPEIAIDAEDLCREVHLLEFREVVQ